MTEALEGLKQIEKRSNEYEILREKIPKLLRGDIKSFKALRKEYEASKLDLELLRNDLTNIENSLKTLQMLH